MKPIYPLVGIIAIIVIGVIAFTGVSSPDISAMIDNQDCDAIGSITDSQLQSMSQKDQFKVEVAMTGCVFDGGISEDFNEKIDGRFEK